MLLTLRQNKSFNLFLLTLAGLIVFLRSPQLFIEPRFWAEEASLYFRYAYLEGIWKGLIFVPTKVGGYLALSTNIISVLASLVPIEFAPFVTTYAALIVIFIPVLLIVYGQSYLLTNNFLKFFALLVYLYGPAHAQEAWLNSINLMSFWGIISLLILCEDTSKLSSRRRGLYYLGLLLFAGLTGVYTIFMAPAFLLKFILEKNRWSFKFLAMVVIAGLIQTSIFIGLYLNNDFTQKKLTKYNLSLSISSTTAYHLYQPFVGMRYQKPIFEQFDLQKFLVPTNELSFTNDQILIIVFSYILVLGLLLWKNRNRASWLLFVAYLFISSLTTIFAMNGVAGSRYAIVPGFALLFLALSSLQNIFVELPVRKEIIFQRLRGIIVALSLIFAIYVGVRTFKKFNYSFYAKHAPHWTEEIALWKQDPSKIINIWPHPRWVFQLSSRQSFDALNLNLKQIEQQLDSAEAKINFEAKSEISDWPHVFRLALNFNQDQCSKIKNLKIILLDKDSNALFQEKRDKDFCKKIFIKFSSAQLSKFFAIEQLKNISFQLETSESVLFSQLGLNMQVRSDIPALF